MSVTIHAWYVLPYLAVGVVLLVPLNWFAIRQIHNHGPFAREIWADMRRWGALGIAWRLLVQVALWPVAVWELVR